jgi:hypothetical protein
MEDVMRNCALGLLSLLYAACGGVGVADSAPQCAPPAAQAGVNRCQDYVFSLACDYGFSRTYNLEQARVNALPACQSGDVIAGRWNYGGGTYLYVMYQGTVPRLGIYSSDGTRPLLAVQIYSSPCAYRYGLTTLLDAWQGPHCTSCNSATYCLLIKP